MNLRRISLSFLLLLLLGCNQSQTTNNKQQTTAPKGELAFLLQYKGQMPSDVGFLTNHIVERRLANMMKDSFIVFMGHAVYDRPIVVWPESHLVAAAFYSDSDRTDYSATVIIDVARDAVWADYFSGDSLIEFADHPSLPYPDME